jgi:hypothetical protein
MLGTRQALPPDPWDIIDHLFKYSIPFAGFLFSFAIEGIR